MWYFFSFFLIVITTSININKDFTVLKEPVTGLEFVLIYKGSFYMGNPLDTNNIGGAVPHIVTISNNFWLSRTEVTLEQWQKVMGKKEFHPEKPNPFSNENLRYPAVCVSYFDVQDFLKRLEELSPGYKFRLPTESEWEYACRAGTRTNFSFGNMLNDSLANYNAYYPSEFSVLGQNVEHPNPVASYPPNQWGLYDMHGNVWEWVSDYYAPYSGKNEVDPKGPQKGEGKVIRGGSWYFSADKARSYHRGCHKPNLWGFSIGFRIVCEKNKIN